MDSTGRTHVTDTGHGNMNIPVPWWWITLALLRPRNNLFHRWPYRRRQRFGRISRGAPHERPSAGFKPEDPAEPLVLCHLRRDRNDLEAEAECRRFQPHVLHAMRKGLLFYGRESLFLGDHDIKRGGADTGYHPHVPDHRKPVYEPGCLVP